MKAETIRARGEESKRVILRILRDRALQKDRGNVGINYYDLRVAVRLGVGFEPPAFSFLLDVLKKEGLVEERAGWWYASPSSSTEMLAWVDLSPGP